MIYKVLVSDPLSEKGLTKFTDEFQVDNRPGISQQELKEIIPNYHALVVRSGTQVTEEIINAGDSLKVIGRAGVGTDNIAVDAATKRGILVLNAPGGNTIAAAEHTMAMMLALARNIPSANKRLLEEKWERKPFVGVELYKKTLGVLGLAELV